MGTNFFSPLGDNLLILLSLGRHLVSNE